MRKLVFIFLLLCLQTSLASGLKDFEGQTQELSSFVGQGQWSVVMIWAHDCPICNEEVQAYDLFHLDHEDGDARVLGISLDGGAEEKAMEFIERHDPSFTNWIGGARSVARLVVELTGRQLMGTPTFLIFDRGGKLRATQAGRLDPQLIEAFIARQEGQKPTQ
jgi:peroxiredoxin